MSDTETKTQDTITLEEARRLQWDAYNSGYNEGYVKGFANGRSAALRQQRPRRPRVYTTPSGQNYTLINSSQTNRSNNLRGRYAHRGARRGRRTATAETSA